MHTEHTKKHSGCQCQSLCQCRQSSHCQLTVVAVIFETLRGGYLLWRRASVKPLTNESTTIINFVWFPDSRCVHEQTDWWSLPNPIACVRAVACSGSERIWRREWWGGTGILSYNLVCETRTTYLAAKSRSCSRDISSCPIQTEWSRVKTPVAVPGVFPRKVIFSMF